MTTTVTIVELDETHPAILFQHYPDETDPQDCMITLDLRDGQMTTGYNPEIGNGAPLSAYHGLVRWWTVPCLTASEANRVMARLVPLADRVLAGARVYWDGFNNVGALDEDAEQAEQEIRDLLHDAEADLEIVAELDAGEWFSEGDLPEGLTADTTDDEIEALATEQEREAADMTGGQYTVLTGAREYLTDQREGMRYEVRERLSDIADEIEDLTGERDRLIRRLRGWGDTARSVGGRANLSHSRVLKIVKKGE